MIRAASKGVSPCRGNGATERELEALAIYMGHSMEMQRGTYDRQALVTPEYSRAHKFCVAPSIVG